MTATVSAAQEKVDACFLVVETQCVERGLVPPIRLACASDGHLAVRLYGATRTWDISIDCTETLLRLPRVSLVSPAGLLAHVSYSCIICVNDGQGLSIDPDRRADIVAYTLLAAYDLLEKSATDAVAGRDEFFNELEGYWASMPETLRGRAAFEPDGKERLISAYLNARGKQPKWYFADQNQPLPPEFYGENLATKRALYLHLDDFPLPPENPGKVDADFIEAVRAKLSVTQLQLWAQLFGPSKGGPKQIALLVTVPRADGGRSLVGMAFTAIRGAVDRSRPIIPLVMRRHTPTYMRERGGASLELLEKHIAVLGCGAVGAVVADNLAAAGVGKLTLVDNDEFSEDNVFRHLLTPLWIDANKVAGLRHTLERRYPGISVEAVPWSAQTWLSTAKLDEFDGIVVAIGAPSIEREIARGIRRSAAHLPVVFTWLEALDLGGHSVLTWCDQEGCLDCLYRDDEGQSALAPRTSFLEPNQHVSRNLTGCASTFVPYGALQARKTGLVAVEHILGALHGKPEASYKFWVGDGVAAQNEGLRTTNWWMSAKQTSSDSASLRVFGRPCKRCRGTM
ncbi:MULTISPECIES: ThiF family adenylyltransferase [Burkholderia]|uniref:ThiF family adenylyltransferase n=1 Tax=Burkholderia TaxID=32008 RepID=UPI00158E5755|nr:ThiF family adenylyltransferase [Burkholderia ambifaria]